MKHATFCCFQPCGHARTADSVFPVHSSGLGNGLDTLIETDDLVEDEDIAAAIVQPRPKASDKQQAAELLGSLGSLSARERNRLKRKAKALNRTDSNPLQGTIGQAAAKVNRHCRLHRTQCVRRLCVWVQQPQHAQLSNTCCPQCSCDREIVLSTASSSLVSYELLVNPHCAATFLHRRIHTTPGLCLPAGC